MPGRNLLLMLLLAPVSFRCFADAERDVARRLEVAGLATGYDETKRRFVVVGIAERNLPDLSPAAFDKARNDLWKIAMLNARRDLMYLLDIRVRAKDSAKTVVRTDLTVNEIRTVIEQFAKVELHGCKVLCSAESYDEFSHAYQVAMAIGWSEKVSNAAAETSDMGWTDVDDKDRYVGWCKENDLSSMIGSRDFTDSDGRRRYVGIGAVDVDGLRGRPLAMAMRKAEMKAWETLTYALSVDASAHDVAQRFLHEISVGGMESRQIWAKFVNEVLVRHSGYHRNLKTVYAATVLNPITNRPMHVVVCGVTAAREDI